MILEKPNNWDMFKTIWEGYKIGKTKFDYLTLYIHIPYCLKKCKYCMFDVEAIPDINIIEKKINNGLEYLEEQFKKAEFIRSEKIRAMFIGGGSASLMKPYQIEKLFSLVEKYWDIEKTNLNMLGFEANIIDINETFLESLSKTFINRLSVGVQSLDDEIQKSENRLVLEKSKVLENFRLMKKYFNDTNVDLIYGFKGQTKESFLEDILSFIENGASRITVYGYIDKNKNRFISDEKEYDSYFIEEMNFIKDNIPEGFYFFGSSKDEYSHQNFIFNRENLKFKYVYNKPMGFNNAIAFSMDKKIGIEGFSTPNNIFYRMNDSSIEIQSNYETTHDMFYFLYSRRNKALLENKDLEVGPELLNL